MRLCQHCRQSLPLDMFGKRLKAPDGLREQCKPCTNVMGRESKLRHKEKVIARNAEYRKANKEKHSAYNKAWFKANRGLMTYYARKYQLSISRAMPKWLTAEQLEEIKQFYKNRPEGCHVDHIEPLQGKNRSGLHVIWNLQYLPASVNQSKGNR